MRKFLLLGLLVLALACDENDPTLTYQIDPELLPYLETFLAEATSRGFDFKPENLIMEFGTTSKEICGQSIRLKNGQRKITIIRNSTCWLDAPSQNRESLVFHELGHCLLHRGHRDDTLPNGASASIMYSQNNGPYSPCIYDLGGDEICDKTPRRNYYINELFDSSTPIPDWAK